MTRSLRRASEAGEMRQENKPPRVKLSSSLQPRIEILRSVPATSETGHPTVLSESRLPARHAATNPHIAWSATLRDQAVLPSPPLHTGDTTTEARNQDLFSKDREDDRTVFSEAGGLPRAAIVRLPHDEDEFDAPAATPAAANDGIPFGDYLFEQGRLGIPIAKPQMRLASPARFASEKEHTSSQASDSRESDTPESKQAKPPAAVQPTMQRVSPPQIDMNAVVENVYRALVRRQQAERERRGWF
jgi:hypothetical protein